VGGNVARSINVAKKTAVAEKRTAIDGAIEVAEDLLESLRRAKSIGITLEEGGKGDYIVCRFDDTLYLTCDVEELIAAKA
jgi:hypothetical protein